MRCSETQAQFASSSRRGRGAPGSIARSGTRGGPRVRRGRQQRAACAAAATRQATAMSTTSCRAPLAPAELRLAAARGARNSSLQPARCVPRRAAAAVGGAWRRHEVTDLRRCAFAFARRLPPTPARQAARVLRPARTRCAPRRSRRRSLFSELALPIGAEPEATGGLGSALAPCRPPWRRLRPSPTAPVRAGHARTPRGPEKRQAQKGRVAGQGAACALAAALARRRRTARTRTEMPRRLGAPPWPIGLRLLR